MNDLCRQSPGAPERVWRRRRPSLLRAKAHTSTVSSGMISTAPFCKNPGWPRSQKVIHANNNALDGRASALGLCDALIRQGSQKASQLEVAIHA